MVRFIPFQDKAIIIMIHIRNVRYIRIACMGLVLMASLASAREFVETGNEAARTSRGYLHVEFSAEATTVNVRDVTVRDLLEEIANQSDLVLELQAPLDDRITIKFDRLPLPRAIARILRDQSYALQYTPPLPGAGAASDARSGTLWVFSPDKTEGDHAVSAINTAQRALMNRDARRRQIPVDPAGMPDVNGRTVPSNPAVVDNNAQTGKEAISMRAGTGDDEQTVAGLATALNDEDVSVREEAIDALGEIGGAEAVPPLEQALVDPDDEIREAAIAALADIGGDESAQALAAALNDEDASLRAEAVDALGEIGGEIATRLLRQALRDQESSVREAAAEALAELAGQE